MEDAFIVNLRLRIERLGSLHLLPFRQSMTAGCSVRLPAAQPRVPAQRWSLVAAAASEYLVPARA